MFRLSFNMNIFKIYEILIMLMNYVKIFVKICIYEYVKILFKINILNIYFYISNNYFCVEFIIIYICLKYSVSELKILYI